jgi:hypothetical protein
MADPNNYDVEVELYFHDIDPLWYEMVCEGNVVMEPESTFREPELLADQAERMAEQLSQDSDAENSVEEGEVTIFGELIDLTGKLVFVFLIVEVNCPSQVTERTWSRIVNQMKRKRTKKMGKKRKGRKKGMRRAESSVPKNDKGYYVKPGLKNKGIFF